jgi:ArsR family transcriptional regulator, arsenate/arsenite/antimonite-responsive transcriptional repressor
VRGKSLGVVAENGRASGDVYDEARVGRLVALGGALSDPIRVRMLGMMAGGRGCCSLPDCGVPAADQDAGICVCEFEAYFGMGQSKVSYHMKKLKGAGLVHEERRGRWSFYSLSRDAARGLLAETAEHLGMDMEAQGA